MPKVRFLSPGRYVGPDQVKVYEVREAGEVHEVPLEFVAFSEGLVELVDEDAPAPKLDDGHVPPDVEELTVEDEELVAEAAAEPETTDALAERRVRRRRG